MNSRDLNHLIRESGDLPITIFNGDELKPNYEVKGDVVFDQFFGTYVILLRHESQAPTFNLDYEMVEQPGSDNTWPFKIVRKKDEKVMGKFKDRYLAGMFLEFLQTHWNAAVAREMALLKRDQRRNSLI